jgi:hypothetical protein
MEDIDEVKSYVNQLNKKEQKALNAAVSAIYFHDSSDYLQGLFAVVEALVEDNEKVDDFAYYDSYDRFPNLYKIINEESE